MQEADAAAQNLREVGVPLLGEVPLEISTRESADTGRPEVLVNPNSGASKAFFGIARRIATMLAKSAPKKAPSGLRIIQ